METVVRFTRTRLGGLYSIETGEGALRGLSRGDAFRDLLELFDFSGAEADRLLDDARRLALFGA